MRHLYTFSIYTAHFFFIYLLSHPVVRDTKIAHCCCTETLNHLSRLPPAISVLTLSMPGQTPPQPPHTHTHLHQNHTKATVKPKTKTHTLKKFLCLVLSNIHLYSIFVNNPHTPHVVCVMCMDNCSIFALLIITQPLEMCTSVSFCQQRTQAPSCQVSVWTLSKFEAPVFMCHLPEKLDVSVACHSCVGMECLFEVGLQKQCQTM